MHHRLLGALLWQVSELTSLCEELQRRVVSLQSGEEVEAYRRQVAEAFTLAERQDELLEDASARLDQLRAECRCGDLPGAARGVGISFSAGWCRGRMRWRESPAVEASVEESGHQVHDPRLLLLAVVSVFRIRTAWEAVWVSIQVYLREGRVRLGLAKGWRTLSRYSSSSFARQPEVYPQT